MRRNVWLLLLAGALACIGTSVASSSQIARKEKFMPMASTTFLALGDSYTIGEAVPESARWPVQLAARLRERGIAIDAPRIIATTGWTTDELSAAMDDSTFAPPYALVTLMIGVNNQYRDGSLGEYQTQFDALLKRAIHLAGDDPTRVLVLSTPDWGATPFGHGSGRDLKVISTQIDAFNAVAHAETSALGATWIDLTPISREVPQHPEYVAHDGLHPSGLMYAKWVELVLPVAAARLRMNGATAH